MQTITLKVEGMSCSHCEHAVKTAVAALDGVTAVEVSLAGKTATVEYDEGKVSPEDFKNAIEEAGYDVV